MLRRAGPGSVPALLLAAAIAAASCCGSTPSHQCELEGIDEDGAAPDLPPGKVRCGIGSCEATKGLACCFTSAGGVGCIPASNGCGMGIKSSCDGPEDCGGSSSVHCCLVVNEAQVACRPSYACLGAGPGIDGTAIVCHATSDCPPDHPTCSAVKTAWGTISICE